MTFDDFKKLTMDEKLDNLFLCVQGMRGVNERLTATENQVRDLRDQADVNSERLTAIFSSVTHTQTRTQLARVWLEYESSGIKLSVSGV